MELMSSTIKASPQLEDVTLDVYCQVKINDNQNKEVTIGTDLVQITRSPSAFLKCTESGINFFNEIEDRKTDSKQDLSHEGCIEGYPNKVELQGNEEKDEIHATENLEKRLAPPEQSMGQEKGTQTQIKGLRMTKQRETETQTTEQGTQTESDISYNKSGRDAKTSQTESAMWLESTQQVRATATARKQKLSSTGNELEASYIPIVHVSACGNDVNKNPERFAAKQLKVGSDEKEVEKTHKRSIPSSPHVISDNFQKGGVLDNDALLSNQRNINWYLSLLISFLTCDADFYNFNGENC